MAPKKKGGKKKQDDDWEAELGETIDPIAQATEAAKAEEAVKDEEGETGGALMAMLKSRKGKKGKKNALQNDFIEGEDAPVADGIATPEVDLESKAPQEVTADDMDEDVFGQPMKKQKGGKGGKAAPPQPAEEDEPEEKAGGGLKSKKEKEKEKKEREKQRKKEQAAKKKTEKPAAPEKKEPAKPVEVKKEAAPEPTPAPAADAKGGKKPKMNAALRALQQRQEELKRRQEEEERAAAEERARIEELERQEAEAEKKREEARQAKKAKEKAKVEQLKKEGKYLTKAQKEAKARQEMRLKQMLEAGDAKVAGLEAPEEKKKPVYDNRKKKGPKKPEGPTPEELEAQKKLEELKLAEEQAKAAEAEAEKARADAEAKKAEQDEDMDDWEKMADAEDDGLKDSWDAPTDEEDSAPTKTTTANGKPVQEDSTVKPAKVVEAKSAANGKKAADIDSESESESEDESSDEEQTAAQRAAAQKKAEAAERRKKEHEAALAARSKDNLRSPICCILGHVDTGKTKLLDKIRQTNVQEGEAGGITQQIGATYFPVDALQKKTAVVNRDNSFEFKVPGLLVIDTPGHESFTNLRSRGSGLCNIAILVVDIMHGLEPQTLESMRLLRDRKTPFVVALNKIDRLFGWKAIANNGFQESLSFQNKGVQNEFKDRLEKTKLAFAEQGFNSEVYYENKNMAKYVSLIPTSAITGEGIPDMIKLIIKLTQERMTSSLMYLSEVEATVLEVKVVEGLGTTIDVILSNGVLHEGDRIVLCGLNGAITTNIRALLTPAEMKELRVKSAYVHNKEVKAAIGVKISADGLDNAIAGSRLLVVRPDIDDESELEDDVMSDLENMMSSIKTVKRGVSVQASTLGSLEALLEFLRVSKIPVANISIGPVFKRDVRNAEVMLERAKEYAVMLCFDVKVDKDAEQYAKEVGVKIFTADIIYHLFDAFTKHMKELVEKKKEEAKMSAVFPCVLKPLAVFNKTDPIVVGVDVIEGNLRTLTPICAVRQGANGQKEIIKLGRVASIEREHKAVPGNICKKGQPSVAVKIEGPNQPMYGRQLEDKDTLYSLISRESIDTLKEFYKEDVTKEEWKLIIQLKGILGVS